MMPFFRVTPQSVRQMVLSLEKAGLISRQPESRGVLRSSSNGPPCPNQVRGTLTSQNHRDEVLVVCGSI